MKDLASINLSPEQLKIVQLTEGDHLVLAPPGTGKTELLAHRVLHALKMGIKEEEMVCLTFTNRAAKSMKDRIEKVVGENKIFIGNIHKFCLNFLFKNKLIPYSTVLIDEQDSQEIFEEILSEKKLRLKDLSITGDDLRRYNSYLKQLSKNFPTELLTEFKDLYKFNSILLNEICSIYERIKSASQYIDFDDLLILTYEFITKNETKNFNKYSWIQVDEIQDLNALQFEIIKLISENKSHKVYFGDYEQAIFSFMGAKLENIHKLEKYCKIHNLQKNFRSPSYLLNVYVDYAKTNLSPKWKRDPYSALEIPTPPNHLMIYKLDGYFWNDYSFTANTIIPDLIKENNSQTAILLRTNDSVSNMSKQLSQKMISHFKVSSFDLFRTRVVKDIMAFLRCFIDENSRMNWTRLFRIFSNIHTLKEARIFVNSLFKVGLNPTDFLNEETPFKNHLLEFFNSIKQNEIIVIDTETTGLNIEEDDIVQIAAVKFFKGIILDTFNIYLKTQKDLAPSQKIHNISNKFLAQNGIDRREGIVKFLEFVKDTPIAAYNLNFDLSMITNNCNRLGIEINNNSFKKRFDILEITKRIYPNFKSYSLENLIEIFNLNAINSHNALDDVKATIELIKHLSNFLEQKITEQHDFIKINQDRLSRFRKNLYEFWNDCKSKMNSNLSVVEFIKFFLEYLQTNFNYPLKYGFITDLEKLFRHMEQTCTETTLEKNLKKYVPEYELLREADLILGDERVIVSTIHRAKGLEFDNVIIPDCNNGNFPYYNSNPEEKVEDARLLYVAMTRAKKRLIIIGSNHRLSPFLKSVEHHFEILCKGILT